MSRGFIQPETKRLEEDLEHLEARLSEVKTELANRRKIDKEAAAFNDAFVFLRCPSYNPMNFVDDWARVTVGDVMKVYYRVSGEPEPSVISVETVKLRAMPLGDFIAILRSLKI